MLVVFVGPPGAGKGTQCAKLIEHLKIFHLSTGELLREAVSTGSSLGIAAQEYISAGALVPDPIVLGLVGERLDSPKCDNGCLFDGFPRNVSQARALDDYLEQRGTPLDIVIELRVEHDELMRRLLARKRSDDSPETIENRLRVYEDTAPALLEYYKECGVLHTIEGIGDSDSVFDRIRTAVDSAGKDGLDGSA